MTLQYIILALILILAVGFVARRIHHSLTGKHTCDCDCTSCSCSGCSEFKNRPHTSHRDSLS